MKNNALRILFLIFLILISFALLENLKEENYDSRLSSIPSELAFIECNSAYTLNESFFNKDQTLVLGVRFIYFANESNQNLDEERLKQRLIRLNQNFNESKAGIRFNLVDHINVLGTPSDDHSNIGLPSFDHVDRFDMTDFNIYNYYLANERTIDVYIFHEPGYTEFAGQASSIPGTYMCIREDFFFSQISTLEHEIGHLLGLYHTHSYSPTIGYDAVHGDKVCDTPYFISMLNKIGSGCDYTGKNYGLKDEEIETIKLNYMSYSMPCRSTFTEGQVMRMRWIIEQSLDLRNTLLFTSQHNKTYELLKEFLEEENE